MLCNPVPRGVMQLMEAEQKISTSKGSSAPEQVSCTQLALYFFQIQILYGLSVSRRHFNKKIKLISPEEVSSESSSAHHHPLVLFSF